MNGDREVGLEPEQPVRSKMTNTLLGAAIGPGVGLSLGLVFWGAEGIPLGSAIGAGVGIGAAFDEMARRSGD